MVKKNKLAKILRQVDNLKFLSIAKPKHRSHAIDNASPDLINAICECVYNVLKMNLPLPAAQLEKLKRHKKTFCILSDKKVKIKDKKKLLKLRGGFLPFIIPAVLSLVASLAGKAIGTAAGL
jgi:hypothetical protein